MTVLDYTHYVVTGVNTRKCLCLPSRATAAASRTLRRKYTKRMTSYIHHLQRYSTIMLSVMNFIHTRRTNTFLYFIAALCICADK